MLSEKQRRQAEEFSARQREYSQLFQTALGAAVLKDLAVFCRADMSTFHEDPRIHAVLEGRREVWLRIQDHLKLTPEAFLEKYLNIRHLKER